MTQEERLEYNIRCAEFLGWGFNELSQRWNENMLHDYSFVDNDELKFHSDWNWIMEVVETIEKCNFVVKIHLNSCFIQTRENFIIINANWIAKVHSKNSKKEAVVQAINQFLIWYKK